MTTARRSKPRVRILPYRMTSESARELSRASGVLRTSGAGHECRFVPRDRDVIVNWGRHASGEQEGLNGRFWMGTVRYYNHPSMVSVAVDKLRSLQVMLGAGVPVPEFTADGSVAAEWLHEASRRRNGAPAVVALARTILNGYGGHGIVPLYSYTEYGPEGDVWPRAPLYTRYFKKRREFRVHVWENQLLDLQEKRRRRGMEADTVVRSYDNGWIFARDGVTAPECVGNAAVAAVRALGLDFGAVDVGYNEHYNSACVFEVNTAPGIEGTTVQLYADKIKEIAGG